MRLSTRVSELTSRGDKKMKNKKDNLNMEEYENNQDNNISLDDDQRIKILSPWMLVFKRFIRNRLAITGAAFILAMFIFSYIGGWLMPYEEDQVFTKYTDMSKVFGGVSINDEYKFITADGTDFPMVGRAQFVLAANNENSTFESQDVSYSLEKLGEELYNVSVTETVATADIILGNVNVNLEDTSLGDDFKQAFIQAVNDKTEFFVFDGHTYIMSQDRKKASVSRLIPTAIATKNRYDYDSSEIKTSYDFSLKSELAMVEMKQDGSESKTFTADGTEYELTMTNDKASIYTLVNGERTLYANISRYLVESIYSDIFLDIGFKDKVKELISTDLEGIVDFIYVNKEGIEEHYTIERENNAYTIRWIEDTLVIKAFDPPSKMHIMGTDQNGMDILTRLMYGGRISLRIGFIVVIIEVVIGVILGGIAGYFGGWVDNLLMRIVDTFYSIPSLPIFIIIGAMLDAQRVDPQLRMLYLMIILAILGWPGIARMTRGQILSLREQEFMIATEATGLSVSKRIFKHLIPNVIPQLIVIATLGLGGIILTESVLSFLGLGVKFPFASWGNIISAVSNVHVMTNYLFVWIPAGFCILITVLGFNFIGDGLRDAFDPKMKR